MQRTPLSVFLDAIRILAAFMVVLGHAQLGAFGKTSREHMDFAEWLIYRTGSFAHMAVIVFFVISGYLVGGKLYGASKSGFLPKYLLDRGTRIYIVALPMLVIGFLLMLWQQWIFGYALKLGDNTCDANLGDLLGTITLIHDGFGFKRCFDAPVWSLIYEVFYYLFFAMMAVAWFRWREPIGKVCAAIALVLGLYGLLEPGYMYALSTIWLVGMALAQRSPFAGRGLLFTIAIVALFLLQAGLRWRLNDGDVAQELIATIGMSVAIVLLKPLPAKQIPAWMVAGAFGGAAFSYSLYMAHAPAITLARTIANARFGAGLPKPESTLATMLAYPALALVGTIAGVLCWLCFERYTNQLRRHLEARLGIVHPHRPQAGEAATDEK